jgi:hypothetical protein
MEAKGKVLKELIEAARGQGTKGIDNAIEGFEKQTGEKVTKELWDSIFGGTKKVAETTAENTTKEAPKLGKALEEMKGSSEFTLAGPTPALEGRASNLNYEVKGGTLTPVGPRSVAPFIEGEVIPEMSKAAPLIAPPTPTQSLAKGSKTGLALAGLAGIGAVSDTRLPQDAAAAQVPPTKVGTPVVKTKAAVSLAATASGADAGQVGAGLQAVEPKKETRKALAYKPDDVRAMLREVDKTPFSYDISPKEREKYQAVRDDITEKNNELVKDYKAELKDAKTEQQRKDTIVAYASAFEKIGLALTTFFAAKKGVELGQDVSKGVRDLRPTDWMEMTRQHLADYESIRKGANDVLALNQAPLADAQKLNDKQEETASSNAFSRGREEAKRRDDVLTDNQRAVNHAAELNVRERNDAGQAAVNAQNTIATQNDANAFNATQNELNRANREDVAGIKADATTEAAALRVSSRLGINPGKLDEKSKQIYAKLQAGYQTLSTHKNDKQAEHEIMQSVIMLGKTQEEGKALVDEAKRGSFSKMFSGEKGSNQIEAMNPSGAASTSPTPGAAPTQPRSFRSTDGKVLQLRTAAQIDAAIIKGWQEVK